MRPRSLVPVLLSLLLLLAEAQPPVQPALPPVAKHEALGLEKANLFRVRTLRERFFQKISLKKCLKILYRNPE